MGSDRRGWARASLLLAVGWLACADTSVRHFPLREPLWVDRDAAPIANKPAERKQSNYSYTIDQTILRPLSNALSLRVGGESPNVNSLDEVPNSSWFTNRIGFFSMTAEEIAQGPCVGPTLDPALGPWKIVSGKANGASPGFVIKAPDGQRYLMKFDGFMASERATAADVIGSKIYYAAGYNAPCNEVVYFPESILVLDPAAKGEDTHGNKEPLTQADVRFILGSAWRQPDGSIRGMASRYLKGVPLGQSRFSGRREDDPNDVLPHEERRELRGGMLFAAWLHHWDAIDNQTLDMLVESKGQHFVRHYMLDWSDCFGQLWGYLQTAQRVGIGREGYFDLDYVLTDLVTLGAVPRPWYHVSPPPMPEVFGYFGTEHFVPSAWRGGYRNAAFQDMTVRDALWAVRIIARFSDEDVAAIVKRGRIADPKAEAFLIDTLIKRRDTILKEYLTRYTPLDRFTLERAPAGDRTQSLCFEDLALATKVSAPATTIYRLRMLGGPQLGSLGWRQVRPQTNPGRTCVPLPFDPIRPSNFARTGAPDDDPARYTVIEIDSNDVPSIQPKARVAVHLYDLGPERGFRIAGIERGADVPDLP